MSASIVPITSYCVYDNPVPTIPQYGFGLLRLPLQHHVLERPPLLPRPDRDPAPRVGDVGSRLLLPRSLLRNVEGPEPLDRRTALLSVKLKLSESK